MVIKSLYHKKEDSASEFIKIFKLKYYYLMELALIQPPPKTRLLS